MQAEERWSHESRSFRNQLKDFREAESMRRKQRRESLDRHRSGQRVVRTPARGELLEPRWAFHSQLLVSEVMYAPSAPTEAELNAVPNVSASKFAFIELFNPSDDDTFTLGGMVLTGDLQALLSDAILGPGERAVLVDDATAFVARYGNDIRILGSWQGQLSATKPQFQILDADAHPLVSFAIFQPAGWPLPSHGLGTSLEAFESTVLEADAWYQPDRWRSSQTVHGTPGMPPDSPSSLVLNEVLAGPDEATGNVDAVELYNRGSEAIDISGWYLSDTIIRWDKYRFPEGTIVAPGGYLVLDASQLSPGPTPNAQRISLDGVLGGELLLVSTDETGDVVKIHDALRYEPHQRFSWGRFQGGNQAAIPMVPSLGRRNERQAISSLVISEFMDHGMPPAPDAIAIDPQLTATDLSFVELFNWTTEPVPLAGWRLAGDLSYALDDALSLPSRSGVLLVSFDPVLEPLRAAAFRMQFELPADTPLRGPWIMPSDDESFQSVRLEQREAVTSSATITSQWFLRDLAHWSTTSPWPSTVRSGTTFQRIDYQAPGLDSDSWLSMPATPGTATFESENPFLLPDLVNWDDPLIGFNNLELFDTHPVTRDPILRFATAMANVGQGPLIIEGREVVDDTQQVVQIIQRADGSQVELPAGEYVFHPTHHHVHFANYAEYNLRSITANGGLGEVVSSGEKVSFCLVDFAPYDLTLPNAPPSWIYNECERQTQGISVGWADIYGSELDDQWINIRDVAPGEYWLETVLDPLNLLRESNEDNNVIRNRVVIGQSSFSPDRFDATETFDPHLGTGDQVVEQLSIHRPGDVDRFRWVAPADGMLTVQLRFDRSEGDADLYVWGNGTTTLIDMLSSVTEDDGEVVHFPVRAGSNYFIVVKDLAGFTLPSYSLTLDGPDMAPDIFEPNNSRAAPKYLGKGEVDLSELNVHEAGDQDYYSWTASRTGDVLIDVRFAHLQGDLNLMVLSADGQPIVESRTDENRESVEFRAIEGSTYHLLVDPKPAARSLNYELRIDEVESTPDAFEPNDGEGSPFDVGREDITLSHLNIHRPFNRDVYRWRSSSIGTVAVDLLFSHAEGDLDLVLWSDGEEILFSRSQDDNERFEFAAQQGQEFLIEVRGRNGAMNPEYELRIDGPNAPQVTEVLLGRASDLEDERLRSWPGAGTPLPWPDVQHIDVRFSETVTVNGSPLKLIHEDGRIADIEHFEYRATDHSAHWRLAAPLAPGRWTLRLETTIVDAFGNALDGESNQAGLGSGDGLPGGLFEWTIAVLPGDLSGDSVVDLLDLNLLASGIRTASRTTDLTGDRISDPRDVIYLVHEVLESSIGDANLDSRFDSADLITIFQAGQFEDAIAGNSTWSQGDWDGDGDFTTSDLVFAFQMGGYMT